MPLNLALLCDSTLKKTSHKRDKIFFKVKWVYKRVPDDATRVHKGVGANIFCGVSVLKSNFWVGSPSLIILFVSSMTSCC